MPFPIIAAIVVAVAAIVGVSSVVAINWNEIVLHFKGKRVAVLGRRSVGKTTLLSFFENGTVPEAYAPTRGRRRAQGRRFQLADLEICVRDSLEVSGAKADRQQWKHPFTEASIVFYLCRAEQLSAGDAAAAADLKSDAEMIGGWLDDAKSAGKEQRTVVVLATHVDKDPSFRKLVDDGGPLGNEEVLAKYRDMLGESATVVHLIRALGSARQVHFFACSLVPLEEMEFTVHTIFRTVQS